MNTVFNFKVVLVYGLCAVLLLSCQSSYETQLSDYFHSQYSRDDLLSDPNNARWIAHGLLTGNVHHDHTDGYRYFSSVPKNEKKAAEIYQLLTDQGDKTSQAQLGILYRNGKGVEKNISKSIELLEPVRERFYDASGEYGLALHEYLRTNQDNESQRTETITDMLVSLGVAADKNYIAAFNALAQLYREGKFVSQDTAKSKHYEERSREIIAKKIRLAEDIAESERLALQYSSKVKKHDQNFNMLFLVVSLGAIGATSIGVQQTCAAGCGPTAVDLINWGVL